MSEKKRGFGWWSDAAFLALLVWKGLVFMIAAAVGLVTGEYPTPKPHDLWFVMLLVVWVAGIETMRRLEGRSEGDPA